MACPYKTRMPFYSRHAINIFQISEHRSILKSSHIHGTMILWNNRSRSQDDLCLSLQAPPLIRSVTSEKGGASTAPTIPDTELCPRGGGHWS